MKEDIFVIEINMIRLTPQRPYRQGGISMSFETAEEMESMFDKIKAAIPNIADPEKTI